MQKPLREKVPSSYFGNIPPGIFSLNSPGSIHSLATPKIALTFDLCGGPHGSGYDDKIMDYLIQHNIPATFFVSKLWIEANPAAFMRLARNPLFEIANHGATHSPASVTGASAYGIAGTGNVEQVMAEIEDSTQTIKAYTGLEPKFYRPGTGFSDEASNRIAQSLGQPVVGFTVNADAGATASLASIVQEVSNAPAGAIILAHANHPEGFTAEGFAEGIRALRARGLEFCKLSDGSPFVHN